MRRTTLAMRIFLAILAVGAGTALTAWLVTRAAVSLQLDAYLAQLPTPPAGMGRGRHMILGAAEQSLVNGVNRGAIAGLLIAVVVAALAAVALSRYLSRPLRRLEQAARTLGTGELSHRVESGGPAEIARLADAFNGMADELERSEELRRRLVADVAHELRNPIAALRGQVEGIADGVLAADDGRIASIAEDVAHLSGLVDDLQELALADSGRLRYDMRRLDVCALVAREVDRAAATAPTGVTLDFEGPERPLHVSGDEMRLSEVLRNLLSNAVRHTPQGRVTARVTRDDDVVRVEVADTGSGIAAADLPYVFERFYRADTSRAAHTGGAGLGLSIAKRIVEDHGGTVFAESVEGSGTRIGFTLPPDEPAR
ncbi:MAG: HAMP domain-containing histidine kinase [Actinobacteria bacterium]|nr:MAG: HAMP domain-containing histidine kinase [Actinomycetota bacterium]